MKIGFDISQIAHQGGVATYTSNLTRELSKNPKLGMVYFYSSLRKSYQGNLKNVKVYKLPPSLLEVIFNRWRVVSIENFIGPLDIFHSSDWTQPKTKAKKVTTYHDIVPLKYPEWSDPKIVAVHKKRLALVEKEVDCVIAVSQSTKKDLLEISKIAEEKIVVIYEGPTEDFKPQTENDIKKFKEKYSLPERFILAIGGIGERKNMQRLKDASKDYNLVIARETLPHLNREELGLLYASSEALLYPSLYEGFGLPILDAFASGLPVITSNVSSMPEVGGDAVLYVDPYSVLDIKEKIKIITSDKDLRKELIRKGLLRLKQFSWEKAAKETADVYEKLV